MRFDGMKFRLARSLGFRDPKPGECYVDGKPINAHYCVFVRIADCETYEQDGQRHYKAETAKFVPITAHSLTNMAYGPWAEHKRPFGPSSTWESHVYLAYDGRVYTHKVSLDHEPNEYTMAKSGLAKHTTDGTCRK